MNINPTSFKLSLIAPEKLLFAKLAEMVVIPGAEGEFAVLAGHISMVSAMQPGLVLIYNNKQIDKKIFVFGGFVEVTPEGCNILAEEAFDLAEITREEIVKRLDKLNQDLVSGDLEHEDIPLIEDEIEKNKILLELV